MVDEPTGWFRRSASAVLAVGTTPDDPPDERTRKGVLTIFGLCILLGTPWDAVAVLQSGQVMLGATALVYTALTLVGFVHFAATKRRWFYQTSQFLGALVVPFFCHVLCGGFQGAGAFLLWSALAPVGALLLTTRRQAAGWLGAYVVVVTAALTLESGRGSPLAPLTSLTRLYLTGAVFLGYPAMVFALVYYFVGRLEAEQAKSEHLLLNILPRPIARRLKDDGGAIADGFAEVTVLFADIVGFTKLSASLPAAELVHLLNRFFTAMDARAAELGIEKIKTIGDAYMAAAGLPVRRDDHAEVMARFALAMLETVERCNADLGCNLGLRIGMNTGPVVAGVIGTHKFIYDLWGDTVNTASRMDSHDVPDRVQFTGAVFRKLDGRYEFEARGVVEVKGKGPMPTWFLLGPRNQVPS